VPSAARFRGFRVVIYPNDHRPAHVHVIGGGGEAVINLRCPDGPVGLREVYGLSRAAVARITGELQARLAELCAEWERIHGQP
jgi:hypothetical protein